jgi:hypothetical protein
MLKPQALRPAAQALNSMTTLVSSRATVSVRERAVGMDTHAVGV